MTFHTASKRLRVTMNRALVSTVGLKVRRQSVPTRYWAECFHNMKRLGFHPKTIVDVGVLSGTPELYAAFPDSKLLLFEPNQECEPFLKLIASKFDAKYWLVAAGAQSGTTEFWVWPSERDGHQRAGRKVAVPVIRLDEALRPYDVEMPALLKVDVEGYELEVIEGCVGLLDRFEAVILETRFFKNDARTAEFADVVARMHALGFVAYDLLDGVYRRQDGVLDFVDLVFVQERGILRSKIFA